MDQKEFVGLKREKEFSVRSPALEKGLVGQIAVQVEGRTREGVS